MQNREIEIHDKGGRYFSFWVPKTPRVLEFDLFNAKLLCAGSGSEIYSIDLEQGMFLDPIQSSYGVNSLLNI